MRTVLVTGGAGYVGGVLVPLLLNAGWRVRVFDLMLFGEEGLPKDHPQLEVIRGDLRDTTHFAGSLEGVESVIHLACISNDPCFELDPDLSRSINYDCFEPMVKAARQAGARRFIYASTSSVYGVSDEPEVTETHPLVPLTDYNKYKGLCEPILLRYQAPEFTTTIIRPATVCGYSPRMRFDLTVNIFTNQAVCNRKITVFGGSQRRPNIHIDDISELYVKLLDMPVDPIAGEIFNAGYQNYSILELAKMVKSVVEREMPETAPIELTASDSADLRSYHVNSDKIARQLGFVPRHSVEDAIRDICQAFQSGKFMDSFNDRYFNVRTLLKVALR